MNLTPEQQEQVIGILSVGCDRQTAADYIGCSLTKMRAALSQDPSFAVRVHRAEAGVELLHMRNVQELSKDKKDWRASVWWLERRSPERYGRRSAGVVTTRQLKAFIAMLVEALHENVHNAEDRERFAARLRTLTETVDQMLRDVALDAASAAEDAGNSPSDSSLGESNDSFADLWASSLGEYQ
jgi:hypothetical protein